MRLENALAILACSILLSTGAAFAEATKNSSGKENHAPQKSPPAPVQHLKPQQAPIVMGRSISVHRKSKLHHVKIKPSESAGLNESDQL
jgi:hypothetical protein